MCKKLLLIMAIGMLLSPAARAAKIIWVAEAITNTATGANYDQGWVDLLKAQGYTVDIQLSGWMTLTDAQIATVNSADLVIFSRTTNSGNYATDAAEVTQWNSVTAPLISLSGYQTRNNRWLWINSSTIVEAANAPKAPLKAVKTDHPIFTGMTLDNNGQVDVINDAVDSGQMSYIVATDAGNGTILGTRASDGNIWIEEWAAGKPFYSGSTQTPAGKRMLLTAGGGTGQTMGSLNFNAAGQKIFLNAVLYMMGKPLDANVAVSPSPADAATDQPRDVDLSWTAGAKAATHDVYFGTGLADVNTASRTNPKGVLVSQGQSTTTFDPGILPLGQTYYWRVDELEQNGTTHPGSVWSFTMEPPAYAVTGITATASSSDTGRSPNSTVDKSGLTGDLCGTDVTTMWLSAKGGTQPAWIQYNLGKVYKLQDLWVWNCNTDFEFLLGIGVKNATVQYSTDAANWTTLGTFDFAQGTSAAGYEHNTTISFGGVAAQYVKINVNSGWGTIGQYGLSEVRFYYLPVQAKQPQPAAGATAVAPEAELSWRAGREAASHRVYIGTDPNALALAGTSTTTSFTPAALNLGTTYYWRVDEVNAATTPDTWTGDVWSFTTADFLVVDNMESYTDNEDAGEAIYQTWVDGFDDPTKNGAVVGLNTAANGTFGSTTIFHGGKQSLPLAYTNTGSVTNSEATRTFDSVQDWTGYGVKTLTLYFYGQAANTKTIPLWVRLADASGKTAQVAFGSAAGEDTLVLADPAWTTWNIPLSSFPGITLAKIKAMTIGVGPGAGSGTLYIDDIRLYPAVTTTVTPATLVGWWKLDNNVQDSSGAGNNGTIVGAPTYVAAGKIGASLKLNGLADYVTCGNAAPLNMTDAVTVAAWIKPRTFANAAYQTFISKGDHAYVLAHTSGNVLQLAIYDGTWYSANSAAVTSMMNNSWHHIAGTYDGTQVRLYVDGVMAGSALHTGVIATDTYVLALGTNSEYLTTRLFAGEMDDVRVYHGALPTAEILKLVNP